VLQPGTGPIDGDYLPTHVDEGHWGYLPRIGTPPVLRMSSGQTVTIDGLSHEGLLEEGQGRDPVAWSGSKGVPREQVLQDGIHVAQPPGAHHRHRAADAERARLVGGRQHHPAAARPADDHRGAAQRGAAQQ
jgi:hypothetical protein